MIFKLWTWIKSLFAKKSPPQEEYEPGAFFKPKERIIYGYFNGEGKVYVDPAILWQKVMSKGVEISNDLAALDMPSKFTGPAYKTLMKNLREGFGVKPFEEGGLTDTEMFDLLQHFIEFCGDVKKNWYRLPMQLPGILRTTSQPEQHSEPQHPPTPTNLDSGSSETGTDTDNQTLLPSE